MRTILMKPALFLCSGTVRIALVLVFAALCAAPVAHAFSDSFSDGNFTSPVWTGDVSNWTVVANSTAGPGANGSQTLRLNTTTATAGVQQLRTQPGSWGTAQQWSFWFGRRAQSATASNRLVFWLYASGADLAGSAVHGYALTFGDDTGDDDIRLVRVDNGVETVLAISATAVPNNITDYGIAVQVERSATGEWQLYTSALATLSSGGGVAADATGAQMVLQATATDTIYTPASGGYFGIAASHTSAANPRSAVEFDQLSFTGRVAVALAGATTACVSSISDYSIAPLEDVEYHWTATGGVLLAGQNTHQISVQWGDTESGVVSLTLITADQYTTSGSLSVDIHPYPVATVAVSGSTVLCPGSSATLIAPAGMTYLWSNGATSQSITVVAGGSYSVVVANAMGCSTRSAITTVEVLPLAVDIRVVLEGAFTANGAMSTHLLLQELVPVVQPYNAEPYNYGGNERLATTSTAIVDWVLVELRTGIEPEMIAARKAALLLADGRVVDSQGGELLFFGIEPAAGYYIAVYHRNHLGVISAEAKTATACTVACDFTVAASAYEEFMEALRELSPDFRGMAGGDINADGIIDAVDRVAVRNASGLLGYRTADCSLDGIVNAVDRVVVRRNHFRASQVP